jgi:ApaG protein
MPDDIKLFQDLRVKVDDVIYMPSLDAPPEKPHPFVYFISIFNNSPVPVTIRARKWVVVESGGETIVVEGQGVVGQQPEIEPGDHFSYNSYHVIGKKAVVSGAFFAQSTDGKWGYASIPEFQLNIPGWA